MGVHVVGVARLYQGELLHFLTCLLQSLQLPLWKLKRPCRYFVWMSSRWRTKPCRWRIMAFLRVWRVSSNWFMARRWRANELVNSELVPRAYEFKFVLPANRKCQVTQVTISNSVPRSFVSYIQVVILDHVLNIQSTEWNNSSVYQRSCSEV